uniref:Major facilitator superfamily (MFS) profile domain-containing protein n=1 Tax=Parascaris univalens TaxID=6257 RepID=A0A915AEY9_PARUN
MLRTVTKPTKRSVVLTRTERDLSGSVQLTCRKHDSLQKGTKLFLCYDIAKVIMEAVQLNKETGSEGLKSNKVTKRHLA